MNNSIVPVFILLLITAGVLIYVARPEESPEQFASRTCEESPISGVTYDNCVEARRLQRHAGRIEDER